MLTKLSDSWKKHVSKSHGPILFKKTWTPNIARFVDLSLTIILFFKFFILHQKQGHHVPKHFLASYGGFHGGTTSSHPFYPFSVWIFTKGFSLEKSFQL